MILKKRRRYYAVLDVPKDLRPHYQKTKLVKTLETESLSVAKRREAVLVSTWKSEFAELRAEGTDDATYYRRQLQGAASPVERNRVLRAIELEADNLSSPTYTEDVTQHRGAEASAGERAASFYDRATGQIVGTTDHLDEWLENWDTIPRTKAQGESVIRRFALTFPTIQDITHDDVQRWVYGLDVARSTSQRIVSSLRGYWRHLQRADVKVAPKDFNPFSDLDLPKKANGPKDQRKPFTTEDVGSLLKSSGKDLQLRNLITLAAYTGCRIEELCSLKVENIHPGYIEIEDAKTAAGWRQVPIHSEIRVLVEGLRRVSKDSHLLSGLTFTKYGDRSSAVGKRFGRLKTRMGYGPELVFHSIRKTVATLLENAGVAEGVAADILGHEKQTMTYGLYSGGTSLAMKTTAIEKLSYG